MVRVHQLPSITMTDDIRRIDLDAKYTNEEYEDLDYHVFFKEGGDPDFNPDRNRYIFWETVRKQKEAYIKRQKMFDEKLRERVWAVGSYLRYLEKGHEVGAERYFGKKELARLRGKDFANMLNNVTRIEVPGYTKNFLKRKELAKRKKVK